LTIHGAIGRHQSSMPIQPRSATIPAMKKWLVIAAAVLIVGIGVVVKLLGARSEFATLTVPQQNLAMYDAFWAAVDANYYDPKLLETVSMRDLRKQWRAKAEAADAIRIYWDVLQPLAAKFPHSHVEVRPNFTQEDLFKVFPKGNAEAKKAFAVGPGYEGITIRRPDGTHWIVGDVIAGSPAEKAGITPGWKVLRGTSSLNVSDAGRRWLRASPASSRRQMKPRRRSA
jgi:hypothetical protein